MATKKVDVEIDVKSNVKGSIQELRELRKALRNAAAGSKEFDQITARIRDTEDAIASAKLKADDFAGALEAAPGPLGAFARGIKQVEIATKSWGAALKATGVGLLVGLIASLVGAFRENEEAVSKLEPVLIKLEQTFNGIYRIVEPLFNLFIDLAEWVLPKLADALRVTYASGFALFEFFKSSFTDFGTRAMGFGKILTGVFTLDADKIKEGWADVTITFTKTADAYTEASDRFKAGSNELTRTQRRNAEEAKKTEEDVTKSLEEELRKRQELQAAADAVFIQLLDDEARENVEALKRKQENEKALIAAGYTDLTTAEEIYRKEIAAIAEKYDAEDAAKEKAKTDEEAAKQKAATDIQLLLLDEESRKLLEAEERKQERIKVLQEAGYTDLTSAETLYQQEVNAIKQKGKDDAIAIEQAKSDAITELNQQTVDNILGIVNSLQQIAGKSKGLAIAGVIIEQAAAIGKIVQNTAVANAKAIAVSPVTGGQPWVSFNIASGIAGAAASVAAGVKAINQIRAVSVTNPSSSSSSSSGTGRSLSLPTPPATQAPQIQTTGGTNPTTQIAETLAGVTGRPIKAYVVSGDVSSQQALDRRTSRAATFS